jgi:hypothetical protein
MEYILGGLPTILREGCTKLYCRYSMTKGFIPKEKQLYLPFTMRRTVSMVCFDASQVLASLLLCSLLNCNKTVLIYAHEDA